MDIILGYKPSLAFWRLERPSWRTLEVLASHTTPACLRPSSRSNVRCKPDASCIERLERMGLKPPSGPTEFLVPNASSRVRTATISTSVLGKSIPSSAFVQIADDMFAVSPELCLLLAARELAQPNLIEMGFEFCGRYRSANKPGEDMLPHQPKLTSVAKLRTFFSRTRGAEGLGAARKALPHILENSESPKESQLAIVSCLPYRQGGYGFSRATMNHPVPIPERARGRTVGHTCRCDLYWPDAKLDVEYDSRLHHSDAEKQVEDSARRTALSHQGILVITVSSAQLHSRVEMDKVARAMAKRLGCRLRPQVADWEDRQIRLRAALFGKTHRRN